MPPKKPAASKPGASTKAPAKAKAKGAPAKKAAAAATKPASTAPAAEKKPEAAAKPPPPPEIVIGLKEIVGILSDETGRVKETGRWPLIVDTAGNATTFIRYQNLNYLNACNPGDMEPERLRRALLGAIRYGKPLIIDVMDSDMHEVLVRQFEAIETGLFASLMDKSLMQGEKYRSLVKIEVDGDEYAQSKNFEDENFNFGVVTSNVSPPADFTDKLVIVRVV